MALGFVRSTVELLTCGRGITPVRGFHQLTCPLLYRLAQMLVFLSAALQIGSDVGVRSLCVEVD